MERINYFIIVQLIIVGLLVQTKPEHILTLKTTDQNSSINNKKTTLLLQPNYTMFTKSHKLKMFNKNYHAFLYSKNNQETPNSIFLIEKPINTYKLRSHPVLSSSCRQLTKQQHISSYIPIGHHCRHYRVF